MVRTTHKFLTDLLINPFYIGYLRITDFGIAREWRPENSQDTSGTPGYMGNFFTFLLNTLL
jgi:hypothetical protein